MLSIPVSSDLANDVENIADGILSPVEGFLNQQDFESVISNGRLSSDIPWTIPIILDEDEQTATKIKDSGDIVLTNPEGQNFAILHVDEIYRFDKSKTSLGNQLLNRTLRHNVNYSLKQNEKHN